MISLLGFAKAVVGMFYAPLIFLYSLAESFLEYGVICYEEDIWPWQITYEITDSFEVEKREKQDHDE